MGEWFTRAAAVVALLVVAAIGLSVLGHRPAETPNSAVAPGAPTTTAPQVIQSDTRILNQGTFYIVSFNLERTATVTVSVNLKSGPAIDSYFVGEQGLNAWEAMARNNQSVSFPYMPALTMAPLAGEYARTATLPAGRYALIIDNSYLGTAAPPFRFFKQSPALVAYTMSAGN